jgi:hypothetical protein
MSLQLTLQFKYFPLVVSIDFLHILLMLFYELFLSGFKIKLNTLNFLIFVVKLLLVHLQV